MKDQSPEPSKGGMSRQTFIRVAAGVVGACYAGLIGYPVYRYVNSPIEQNEGAAPVKQLLLPDALKLPKNSALMFRFGSKPAVLIHHNDGSWVALIAICKHLGCTVQFEPEKDRIYCACHGGVYNSHTGGNVSGPPPHPLDRLDAVESENGIIVSIPTKSA